MAFDWLWLFTLNLPEMTWLVVALALVWTMAWKGVALWRAGRSGHLVWFIVMFIINTAGILEIIYIFAISRREM